MIRVSNHDARSRTIEALLRDRSPQIGSKPQLRTSMCWLDGILWLLMGLPWSRVADPAIRSLTTFDASSPNLCAIPHDIGETH
ncbi:MAG TPA: hypothetical protein VGH37_19585, partial [Candidatus Acidoferrum sp.]